MALLHVAFRGGARNFFSLLGGNLYKNLIKIQMFNINLKIIGGPGPCPPSPPLVAFDLKDMPSMRNAKGEKAPIIMSEQNELVSKPQKQRNCWKPGTCKPFGSKQLRLKVFAARKAIHLGRDSMYIPESTRK